MSTSTSSRKLTLADIVDVRAYEREREQLRARVIDLKSRRRLSLGHVVTITFENRETMRHQIQEMARVEKLVTDEAIQEELDIYNPMIPEPGQLCATVFIELTSDEQLRLWLPKLVGIERSFEPWNNANLIPVVLPAVGVVERLRRGARVADVGCGAGGAVLRMAAEFPGSEFVGYDISSYALARANERLRESRLTNAHFADPRSHGLPNDHSVDFVCTFDCIHDMTHPANVMSAIRAALKDDGVWLLVDIKAHDGFALNAQKNPMASLMYGISVLSCMSSALSAPDGAGLGTLGLSATTAESMARAAGFSRFDRLDVEHSVNAFYAIRP